MSVVMFIATIMLWLQGHVVARLSNGQLLTCWAMLNLDGAQSMPTDAVQDMWTEGGTTQPL